MDSNEPHLMLNKKMQPIRWLERPTNALVVFGSLWPRIYSTIVGRQLYLPITSSFFSLLFFMFVIALETPNNLFYSLL
jgi:hypothetical protein